MQEQIRRWLALLDFIHREDPSGKAVPQASHAQSEAHLFVAAAGGDTGRQLDLLKRLDDAWHGPQFTQETLADSRLELRLPSRRRRPPQALGDDSQRRLHPQAEELADTVLVAHLQAKCGDSLCLDAQRDPVAVDQHPVAIEDHKLSHDSEEYGSAMPGQLQVTDDIFLRLLDEADARELHGLIETNRAYLARWLPWAASQTFDDTLDFIRRTRSQLTDNDGFQAAIVLDGCIVGVIGYHAVDWPSRSTRIGYWLDEGHQGRGTMTAAVRLLVDHALTVWQLNRIEIRAAVENRPSRAIPERLGFRQEGTLRQAELIDGRYLDSAMYSMLAADWRAAGRRIARWAP
jgi:ribosomal-protein-serine acetyltransferase